MYNARVFSEVMSFLNIIEKEYYYKIPKKLIELFENNKDNNYNPIYNAKQPIGEQIKTKETLSVIALLDLNYWCDAEEEKNKIKEKLRENDIRHQEKLKEKFDYESLFENKKEIQDNKQEMHLQVIDKKENLFQKIMKKIKNFYIKIDCFLYLTMILSFRV